MKEVDPDTVQLPPGFTAGGAPSGGGSGTEQAAARKAQEDEVEERRKFILEQILTPEAKARLSRIGIVRQEKAKAVGDMLVSAATSGRLGGKVTEEQLIQMLEQVSEKVGRAQTKVSIQRRKYFDDEDEDNDDDLA